MKCDYCGDAGFVCLVDGDWSDDCTALERYECQICGTQATYYLNRGGENRMVGPISATYDT